jgi:hypothetical protein
MFCLTYVFSSSCGVASIVLATTVPVRPPWVKANGRRKWEAALPTVGATLAVKAIVAEDDPIHTQVQAQHDLFRQQIVAQRPAPVTPVTPIEGN